MLINTEKKPLIFAHRGASGYEHENTLKAFLKAIEMGADGIELDVRKTKDQIIIVHHNPNINEFLIKDFTYEELNKITRSLGYQIPTFEETLILCQNKIFLDIELKEPGYEQELYDLITKYYSIDQFMIRSFHQSAIIDFKKIDSSVTTTLLIGGDNIRFGFISRFFEVFPLVHIKKTKCDLISPNYRLLLCNYVKRMHKRNIPVSVWTINTEELMKEMIKQKVDYIITNYPDVAIKIRDKLLK